MAITNGYTTLALLKAELGIADTTDDTALENVIEATSRALDLLCSQLRHCPTRFYTTASDEVRYYTASFEDRVVIDDLVSVTSVKTDAGQDGTYETTLTAYFTEPRNATLNGLPYTHLTAKEGYAFPLMPHAVEVTGKFGFNATASIPDYIAGACLLASERLFKRRDAIFGVSGTTQLGTAQVVNALQQDGELMALLSNVPARPRGLWMHYG